MMAISSGPRLLSPEEDEEEEEDSDADDGAPGTMISGGLLPRR